MSTRLLRIGFLADGVWKFLVGIAMLVMSGLMVEEFGAPAWLLAFTAIVVVACAAAEMLYAVRSAARTHTKYLVAYDFGWVLTTILSVLPMRMSPNLAWTLWLGFQALAAPIVGVVFARAAHRDER